LPGKENASFCAIFIQKTIILPRQARDKHRERTQKETRVFSDSDRAMMCFLNEGVALLREGLQRSPYNFKLKLLLFLLYLELGAAERNKTLVLSCVAVFPSRFEKTRSVLPRQARDTHTVGGREMLTKRGVFRRRF
jgi:hypothetical protein